MKIDFKKISKEPRSFVYESNGLTLKGCIYRKQAHLYMMDALLVGDILLTCDKSGEEYVKTLNEKLNFGISDGIFPSHTLKELEVVEFFDGYIDIAFLLESEVESIKLEYHTKEHINN